MLNGNVTPTVLLDVSNFGPWLNRTEKSVATTKLAWREAHLSGDPIKAGPAFSLSANEISYLISASSSLFSNQ